MDAKRVCLALAACLTTSNHVSGSFVGEGRDTEDNTGGSSKVDRWIGQLALPTVRNERTSTGYRTGGPRQPSLDGATGATSATVAEVPGPSPTMAGDYISHARVVWMTLQGGLSFPTNMAGIMARNPLLDTKLRELADGDLSGWALFLVHVETLSWTTMDQAALDTIDMPIPWTYA